MGWEKTGFVKDPDVRTIDLPLRSSGEAQD